MAETNKTEFVVTNQAERDAAMAAALAFDQAQAAAQAAERAAFLADLKAVIDDPRYRWVQTEIERLLPAYKLDADISTHMAPLASFMSRLRTAAN